ncbi:MAG TPA: MoxR family ATPase [Solirubrobacterales bacterium]|nr:MoxR family ATPase [Solirubrobacterales bacterium]
MTTTPSQAKQSDVAGIGAAIGAAVTGAVVGQEEAVRGALVCLAVGGHALLEGAPGLGKTTLARSLAAAVRLRARRIQFTPDLMPADITGTSVLRGSPREGESAFRFEPGPLFANVVLADEINRAAPRTQSALLEAMQERTVTVAETTHELPDPFIVLATQNPIEMRGTYPLPEAELDRFLLNLRFDYPDLDELTRLAGRPEDEAPRAIEPVAGAEDVLRLRATVRALPAADHVVGYAARLVMALHPGRPEASERVRELVELGPSPRGARALALAGRAVAVLAGRHALAVEDVREVALPALRHRLILDLDAERAGVGADDLIREAIERVPKDPE